MLDIIEIPDDVKQRYIDAEIDGIRGRVSGFSVLESEIQEAAYHQARVKWERDGYYDKNASYVSLHQREKDLLDKVMNDFINEVEVENE